MISQENVEEALQILVDTDEGYATAKARTKYMEHKRKAIEATVFASLKGGVGEKSKMIYADPMYTAWLDEYRASVYEEQILASRRESARLTIDVWRSENANRRVGNI